MKIEYKVDRPDTVKEFFYNVIYKGKKYNIRQFWTLNKRGYKVHHLEFIVRGERGGIIVDENLRIELNVALQELLETLERS